MKNAAVRMCVNNAASVANIVMIPAAMTLLQTGSIQIFLM